MEDFNEANSQIKISLIHHYGYQIRNLFDYALYKLEAIIIYLQIEFTSKDFVHYTPLYLASIFSVIAEADKYDLCHYFHFDFDAAATFLWFCLLVPEVFLFSALSSFSCCAP